MTVRLLSFLLHAWDLCEFIHVFFAHCRCNCEGYMCHKPSWSLYAEHQSISSWYPKAVQGYVPLNSLQPDVDGCCSFWQATVCGCAWRCVYLRTLYFKWQHASVASLGKLKIHIKWTEPPKPILSISKVSNYCLQYWLLDKPMCFIRFMQYSAHNFLQQSPQIGHHMWSARLALLFTI